MQVKEKQLGKIKEKIFYSRALKGSCFALAVFVLAFVFLPYIIVEASAINNDVSLGANWQAVSLEIDTDYGHGSVTDEGHGDVLFGSVTPTERNTATSPSNYGTMKILKKTIGITTNGKYYAVYLSTSDSSNRLSVSGDSGAYIPASNGSWAAPSAMTSSSWGFSVPNTPIPKSDSDPSTPGFTAPSSDLLDIELTAANGGTYYSNSLWAAVPVLGSARPIWKESTDNASGFGTDTFDVYYAAMIDTSVMAGTYENQVVYTVLASTSSLDKVSTNLTTSLGMGGMGDVQNITFDLVSSAQTSLISKNDVKIYLVPHATASSAYNSTTGEYNLATIESDVASYSQCTIIDNNFTIDSTGASLSCSMPQAPGGHIVDGSGSDTAGKFDFWVHIDQYGYDYVSVVNNGAAETFAYVGLQSKKNSTDHYVENMQQMRATICNNTNRWGTGLGADAVLYDYTGTGDPIATGATGTAATSDPGSFKLIDKRDEKPYLVRRLADGNCWMVQNLALDLGSFAGTHKLTPENTNLTSTAATTRGYWDPSESTQAIMTDKGWTA
ncbi:hypothetical protein IKF81_01085, partial [Candidatus Saccharibacteria bacterium]|nr:hypothetical protein [Candidatus Saccharibacteria bacterium]